VLVAFEHSGQHLMDPIRKIWVQSVIHPLALPTVRQQAATAQLREVPGDFWLTLIQRAGQFANTKLSFTGDEHHGADPSVVSQAFENSGRCQMVSHIVFSVFVFDQDEHLDALMNLVKGASAHMRLNEYMFSRMQGKETTTH
jgi:hypothetical protein